MQLVKVHSTVHVEPINILVIIPKHMHMVKSFEHKIVIIFLSISYICKTCVLGAQKNCLIETVLLSTHNICFD